MKDEYYTVLGFITISGKPVVCIIILLGEQPNTSVDTGLDLEAEIVRSPDDSDFFKNNSGPGKNFPGDPTYNFNGVYLPCLFQWSSKGSIATDISINVP